MCAGGTTRLMAGAEDMGKGRQGRGSKDRVAGALGDFGTVVVVGDAILPGRFLARDGTGFNDSLHSADQFLHRGVSAPPFVSGTTDTALDVVFQYSHAYFLQRCHH